MTARPIRRNAQTTDRNGKIFYTSTTYLSHISKNAWIIAEDFEEQRYCCIDVNINDIQDIFLNLSNKLHGLLELHHR